MKKSHGSWLLINGLPIRVFRSERIHSKVLCIMHNAFITTGKSGVQTGAFNYTHQLGMPWLSEAIYS